jgi:hypothetical protein
MSGQLLSSTFLLCEVAVSSVKLLFINLNLFIFLCLREFAIFQSCNVFYASRNSERPKTHFHFLYVFI